MCRPFGASFSCLERIPTGYTVNYDLPPSGLQETYKSLLY
jgi:hypothetical protein